MTNMDALWLGLHTEFSVYVIKLSLLNDMVPNISEPMVAHCQLDAEEHKWKFDENKQ